MAGRYGKQLYSSTAWRKMREEVLDENPLCVFCQDKGMTVAADEVDHIVPLSDAPYRALDRSNLRGLCRPCHIAHTALQSLRAGKKKQGAADDGTPFFRMTPAQQKKYAKSTDRLLVRA